MRLLRWRGRRGLFFFLSGGAGSRFVRPYPLRRVVDVFDKRRNPHIHGPLLNRNERKPEPQEPGSYCKRPGEKKRQGELIAYISQDDAARKIAELLDGHVAHQPELERGDVLRDRMLIHMHSL